MAIAVKRVIIAAAAVMICLWIVLFVSVINHFSQQRQKPIVYAYHGVNCSVAQNVACGVTLMNCTDGSVHYCVNGYEIEVDR